MSKQSMESRAYAQSCPLQSGEKVQFTDRKSNKITDQLVAGGVTQTSHGIILHDDVIGRNEGMRGHHRHRQA